MGNVRFFFLGSTSTSCLLCITWWWWNQIRWYSLFFWRTSIEENEWKCKWIRILIAKKNFKMIEDTLWTNISNLCTSYQYSSRRGFTMACGRWYTPTGMRSRILRVWDWSDLLDNVFRDCRCSITFVFFSDCYRNEYRCDT